MTGESIAGDAAAEQSIRLGYEAVARSKDLQHDFAKPVEIPPPPDWLLEFIHRLAFLAPFLQLMLWGALIVVAGLIIWVVAREFISLEGRSKRRAPLNPAWRPDASTAAALLDEADRLAAENRFAEAVHALMHRSVEDVGRRRPGAVRIAFTGRDLCAMPQIPDEPRAAFARICTVVEISLFGGRPVDAALFADCRREYHTFAYSDAW